jgi:hypothetical protein
MDDRGPVRLIHWAGPIPALSSLPVIVFAFTCHQNVGRLRDNLTPDISC